MCSKLNNDKKKKVPSLLINGDQTDFMTNGFIGDNIQCIYPVISYVNKRQMSGLLLSLDFEKAFDSCN